MLWVDKKYLRLISSRFRNSKWKDDNLLNHSCPYCGDSKKNEHKARGYHFVYKESFVYTFYQAPNIVIQFVAIMHILNL